MPFEPPWQANGSDALVQELRRELPMGHKLRDIPVYCIARRIDRDDVLFEYADGSGRVAMVHLTWSVERDPEWPSARLFADIASWRDAMKADSAASDY